jgi:uncharacterized protein
MTRTSFTLLVLGALGVVISLVAAADSEFLATEKAWRDKRHSRLTSETGWLTLVGLHWLSPGKNAFGSDPGLPVPLPTGKAPKLAGTLILEDGAVRLVPEPGAGLTIDGKPAGEQVLGDDGAPRTDVVQLGDLSFFVIKRGERIGVRVRDKNSPVLKGFKGIDAYDPDPKYRVTAAFHAYVVPRQVDIPNVLGMTERMEARGNVTFTLDGREHSLEPVIEDPEHPQLWFIFKDATSGKSTYGGGRFLYAEMPKDGTVTIDFNQAYNPPCAFTPYATCPLPPKQNWLSVPIEAGEKTFHGAGH